MRPIASRLRGVERDIIHAAEAEAPLPHYAAQGSEIAIFEATRLALLGRVIGLVRRARAQRAGR